MAAVLAPTTTTLELVAQIKRGLPARAAFDLKELLGVSNESLAQLLGMSVRTFARLDRAKGVLDAVSSDRLHRVARLVGMAVDVLEDEAAAVRWLKMPQHALGDAVPLDLLGTDVGARAVEVLLGRMEYGVYT